MPVMIYRTNRVGLKDMLVSDSTNLAGVANELTLALVNSALEVTPVVIQPKNKLPVQLLTTAQFLILRSEGIPEVTESQMMALVEAWQAANP